ncbi:putative uncharacterized protein DDB_G0282129 isoform X6 [Drosophila persimilis]|uniref:putative uncharacterized protein DDB_G0282129 isoform X6 n=1 Tax=Drosophila persimilis TaxID=7234 RepID=UPI000F09417B|nr:putative uncharacterized protein DDB_G0282129 isoform X6 [Drosophila persimilis]
MMLQSLNLHADTLSGIPEAAAEAVAVAVAGPVAATEQTNEAAAAAAATTTMLTTAPVALIANGSNNTNSSSSNNNNINLYNNNNLNSNNNCNVQQPQQQQQQQQQQLQQQQQQQLQLQLQPVKYLENLTSSGATSGAIAATTTFTGAAKSFHPYLRPTCNTNSNSNNNNNTASLIPATTKMSTALLETLLQNQINSSTTTPTVPTTPTAIAAVPATPTAAGAATTATTAASAVAAATAAAAAATQLNSGINSRTSLVDQSQSQSQGQSQPAAVIVVAAAPPNVATSVQNRMSSPLEDDLKTELEAMDTNSNEMLKDQPDADNIKMFVGQIPKTWDETRLRQMFEQFGPVHTLNVLRDKVTSISRDAPSHPDEAGGQ